MSGIGEKFSRSTSSFAKQAMEVATTTFQAANNALTAGLHTCEEKGAAKVLGDSEIRISPSGDVSLHKDGINPSSASSAASTRSGGPTSPSGSFALGNGNKQLGAGGVIFSSAVPLSERAEIWGNHTFQFTFGLDTSSGSAAQNGCLVARAKRANARGELAIRCRWRRRACDMLLDLPDVTSNVYQISADDIGCKVVVEASLLSRESDPTEVAHGELGPFEMNAATRRSLDNSLACESTRFPVRMMGSENPDHVSDPHLHRDEAEDDNMVLHVTSQDVKLLKPGPRNVGFTREWTGRYAAEYPQVKLNLMNTSSFELFLGPRPTDRLRLTSLSRSQRDLIALTIRCFHARQYIATTAVLEHITQKTNLQGAGVDGMGGEDTLTSSSLDLFVMVQRLVGEINSTIERQEKFLKERNRAITEKEALEEDITATIEAYQQLLLSFQSDDQSSAGSKLLQTSSSAMALDITQRAAHVADLESRLKESQARCSKYLEELELLRRDYRALEMKRRTETDESGRSVRGRNGMNGAPMDGQRSSYGEQQKIIVLEQQVENLTKLNNDITVRERESQAYKSQLTEEMERLRSKALDFASIDMSNHPLMVSATEQVETFKKEVERLKKELEAASYDKQSLTTKLNAIQQDNRELTENFLYIKNKYDGLKSQQLSADEQIERRSNQLQREKRIAVERIAELERELEQAQTTLDAVITDKNRLVKKAESLSKDLTKSRTDLESSTQRLMEANAQLLEEKTCTEKSLKKLEKTVEDQKSQIYSLENTVRSTGDMTSGNVIGSDTRVLLIQLKEKDEIIRELKAENATLKSRVRKLASMG